jgi:hypothetical protein
MDLTQEKAERWTLEPFYILWYYDGRIEEMKRQEVKKYLELEKMTGAIFETNTEYLDSFSIEEKLSIISSHVWDDLYLGNILYSLKWSKDNWINESRKATMIFLIRWWQLDECINIDQWESLKRARTIDYVFYLIQN